MFVIHVVQLQKVCGSDNWMTPREGKKHEKKKKKLFMEDAMACRRPASGWTSSLAGPCLQSALVLLAKAGSSKTLVPGLRPHPWLSGSMLSTHFGSWGSLRENYISVSKWATELEKANCL